MSMFQRATKDEGKLRLAIIGPSGSGKTFTSLAIAMAMGGPVAVVDTEHGSASKYADQFEFDVVEMHAPFKVDKYLAAIADAQQAGYNICILDSISHAWMGTGGILDFVDETAKRMKNANTFAAWKEGTPLYNSLVNAIVESDIHVIATMRSKTEYVMEANNRGKQTPRKIGMAPVQRDGFEYEFDVLFDMDMDNNAIVSKTRCPALNGRIFAKPGADVAEILTTWLSATPPQEAPEQTLSHDSTQSTSPGPNGTGRPTQPATGETVGPQQNEQTFNREKTTRNMHRMGTKLWPETWDEARHTCCQEITKGRTESSKELSDNELAKFALILEVHEYAFEQLGDEEGAAALTKSEEKFEVDIWDWTTPQLRQVHAWITAKAAIQETP
ncbi:hypothetical protein LCGC14_0387020 [marine sediment metagenome]|uniref:AAA+ ATPase domain-containing protein n=1 Tax=marine sediment metagenome TaxID=412755 RepID=A0A0F9T6J3_9ZZZZ